MGRNRRLLCLELVKTKNAYRLEVVRTKIAEPSAALDSPSEVAKRYRHLERYDRERLVRLDLDNRNRVIGEEAVSIGTADAAIMGPREVFRGTILNGASRIILVHNHPAGNPEPSSEDMVVWEKLVEAGELLAVPVVDFVIIGKGGRYRSVYRSGACWADVAGMGRETLPASCYPGGERQTRVRVHKKNGAEMPYSQDKQTTGEDPSDVRFGEILNDFLDRREDGEPVREAELLAAHPEFAEELCEAPEAVAAIRPSDASIDGLIEQGVLAPSADSRFLAKLGSYKVIGLIGRGGMGVVLSAYEESLNRTVALKVLRPDLAQDKVAIGRFTREAKAAAALRDPNIITVYAVGEEHGTYYIAMEHIDGPSLADVIHGRGPLPTEMTRQVFRELMSALTAAHEAGLIHRDIKSSNILLDGYHEETEIRTASANERSGRISTASVSERPSAASASEQSSFTVKLADFGLARILSSQTRMTLPDSIFGTPEYMSPEQARGDENIDHRTDLYSAGVVLYETFTGRTPFKAETPSAVIHRVLHDHPPDPRILGTSCDTKLASLALRLMAKRPEDRFDSAAEALAALEAREPVGVPERAARMRRRLAVAVAVAAMVVVSGWLLIRLPREPRDSPSYPVIGPRITRVRIAPEADPAVTIEAQYGTERAWEEFVSLPEEASCVADPEVVETPDGALVVARACEPVDGYSLFAFWQDGRRAWKADLSDDRRWPDCSPPSKWITQQILPVDLDGRAGDELIVVATELREYPTRVSIIDLRDGSIKSTFWNLGGLGAPLLAKDFFGSGRPALVIAGLNNKLDGFDDGLREGEKQLTQWDMVPVLMVIDPHSLDGVGPPRCNRLPELSPASVYAYAFLDMPYKPELIRVTQSKNGRPPAKARAVHLARDDMARIEHLAESSKSPTPGSGPFFDVNLWSYDDQGRDVGRAILTVDRNLNLVAVTPASVGGEIVGTTIAYWEQFWKPLIRQGKYVAD